MTTKLNLTLDYAAMENMTFKDAYAELKRIGKECCSPLELLDEIGFEHDYIMDALDFVMMGG